MIDEQERVEAERVTSDFAEAFIGKVPRQTLLNRYRIATRKPLGGGGMKEVYLAEDLRLAERPCAVAKMMDHFYSWRPGGGQSKRFNAR